MEQQIATKVIQNLKKHVWTDLKVMTKTHQEQELKQKNEKDMYYSYFQQLIKAEEISQRCFHLSGYMLLLQNSNYYALAIRKDNLQYCDNFQEQMDFVDALLKINSKGYHLWKYKKYLIEKYKCNPQKEFAFLNNLLQADQKIYQVWEHRNWLVRFFNFESKEIKWTEDLIYLENNVEYQKSQFIRKIVWKDCYSLWNYRFHLLKNCFQKNSFQKQLKQLLNFLKKYPFNQCGWNYLNQIFLQIKQNNVKKQFIAQIQTIEQKVGPNRFLLNSLLMINVENIVERKVYIEKLKKIDNQREKYYKWLQQKQQKINS